MSYKTILVHVDGTAQAHERARIAAMLACAFDAHLAGAAPTGFPATYFTPGAVGGVVVDLSEVLDRQRRHAKDALAAFERVAGSVGAGSVEARVIDEETGQGMCTHARYCDLVVLGQFDPAAYSPFVRSDFPEYVILNSGRPVLLVPYAGHWPEVGKRVLVAWDASVSATRAVANALPLLKRAGTVQVVVFRDAGGVPDGEHQPGADIALYLARHQVAVEVVELVAPVHQDIGDALLSHASQSGTDLIVMGGYGHPRLRELVMGGATRQVLASMTVPVLMSH